jgi:hypothetical protein
MNTLSRTIIVLVAVNLIPAGLVVAQNVPDKETQDAWATRKDAEVAAKIAEQQAEAAQKQIQAAQQQVETAQRQIEVEKTKTLVAALAAPDVPNVPVAPVVPTRAISFKGPWLLGSGGVGSVLVIPTAELKMEELAAMTEDMSVMSRLFEKNLEQARLPATYGTLFGYSHNPFATLLGGGGGVIQSMYLQGYGALFLMKVDFPLSPPPQAEQKQEEETKKEETDPVWQQMRSEMYEPQEATRRRAEQPEEKYDAEKVENLKTALVKALKHAANIRSLKPDESVILTVAGSGGPAGTSVAAIYGHQVLVQEKGNDGKVNKARWVGAPSSGRTTYFAPTVLVIRAKKSDIDSFAKDGDYEQFRQRTQLLTCPYLGAEAERGDPFNMGRVIY